MKVTFVHNEDGDWIAMYVDGNLVYANHSIDEEKVAELLGVSFQSFYVKDDFWNDYRSKKLNELELLEMATSRWIHEAEK